ncbi:MAG: dTDP-4-dehydrorhamnose 3,5-epimerase family protein [Acidimicrobiales bacterium]
MRFTETELPGVWLIEIQPIEDERGFFARSYCRDELAAHGLEPIEAQANMSHNPRAGTLRGMHLQLPPAAEVKLVRCTRGAVHDVVVDCRPGSPTRWRSFGVELSADDRRALYVPRGFAHGYQTLVDDTDVFYQVSVPYAPGHEVGLRFDDPDLGLVWPHPVTMMSEKDRTWPLLSDDGADRFGGWT